MQFYVLSAHLFYRNPMKLSTDTTHSPQRKNALRHTAVFRCALQASQLNTGQFWEYSCSHQCHFSLRDQSEGA